MIARRDFLQAAMAATALTGAGIGRLAAAQGLTEAGLVDMAPLGNVSLIHVTDVHAQLVPMWFREPSINLGVGEAAGQVPHVTGADLLKLYNIAPGSAEAHALASTDFEALAREYGKMGGLDRVASVVKRHPGRAARGDPPGWRRHLAGLADSTQDERPGHGGRHEPAGC